MPTVFAFLRPRLATFFGAGPSSSTGSRSACIVLGLFFCLIGYVASLGGDFPLNDDWAYGETTRMLLQSGRLYMPAACAAGFAHVLWGGFFVKIFGFSYIVLRLSSFVAGAIGAYIAYLALIEIGIQRRESLYCALVYAANPIMINLYLGFMSDIPALSLSVGYFFCLLAGLRRRSLKFLAMALLLLLLAITIRQSTVVLALAAPSLLFARFGTLRRRIVLAAVFLLLPLAAFWAVDAWLMVRDATGQSIVDHYSVARAGHRSFVLRFFTTPVDQCLKSLAALGVVSCYMGLFTTPILLSGCASALAERLRRPHSKLFLMGLKPALPALTIGLFICVLSAYYETTVQHALMPFCENILRITSVGAQGIMGIANPILTQRQKLRLTVLSYLLAWLVLAQLASLIFFALRHVKRFVAGGARDFPQRPLSRYLPAGLVALLACCCATLGFLTVETIVRCTDRYYLIALLPIILAMAYFARANKLRFASPFGIVLLTLFVLYGVAAGQDYICSNAARWRALGKLEGQGIAPSLIDGGAEYNILRDINVYASHYRGEHPRDTWRWWPIRGEEYIISFSPIPDYQQMSEERYFSFLTLTEHPVYVLKKLKLNK